MNNHLQPSKKANECVSIMFIVEEAEAPLT